MKAVDCYLRALQKAEENATNGGIKLDEARFVQLFNDEQNRLVRYFLEKKNSEDIRYIQKLVVYSKELIKDKSHSNPESTCFKIPSDFFSFSNVSGVFSIGHCSVSDFNIWEAKNENIHELLSDKFNAPSFDFRETFYTIGEDSIRIFKRDFEIDKVFLSYYRYPKSIDLEGYIKTDGTSSMNVDPELDDKIINMILNMVEKQFALNESEYNRYQVDSNNVTAPL